MDKPERDANRAAIRALIRSGRAHLARARSRDTKIRMHLDNARLALERERRARTS